MYEMSQRHPVWVAENHVNPCNSVTKLEDLMVQTVQQALAGKCPTLTIRSCPLPSCNTQSC
jgi:hypothetical protein